MSLQKTLYTIRGAAHEQRGLADQCVHAPKLKALSLKNAEDMDAAAKFVEAMHGSIKEAVNIIHIWHGFGPEWETYLRHSPEMKSITSGLTAEEITALVAEPQT